LGTFALVCTELICGLTFHGKPEKGCAWCGELVRMVVRPANTGLMGPVLLIFPKRGCPVLRRNATTTHKLTDGNFNQQQSVPGLWDANHQSGSVHEVLPHQSGWAARRKNGAVAYELQAPG
jgi:hypothetical protein